ncbi:MAG TPA: hypothetical protein VHV30_01630, partial [Polyangiaceae bacterium]|nr:hypothetical protein [Polyangiaceae bacterium]
MGLQARSFPNLASRFAAAAPDEEGAERLRATWRDLLEDVRATRPGDGTPEERDALLRFLRSSVTTLAILHGDLPGLLRLNLDDAMRECVREELATSEVERKLALRHIEFAGQAAGVVNERLASLLDELPDGTGFVQELGEYIEHA